MFLRTLVASGGVMERERMEFFRAIEDIQAAQQDGRRVLEAARDWCIKYERENAS